MTFLELLEEKTEKTAIKLLALMSQDLADESLMKFTSVSKRCSRRRAAGQDGLGEAKVY